MSLEEDIFDVHDNKETLDANDDDEEQDVGENDYEGAEDNDAEDDDTGNGEEGTQGTNEEEGEEEDDDEDEEDGDEDDDEEDDDDGEEDEDEGEEDNEDEDADDMEVDNEKKVDEVKGGDDSPRKKNVKENKKEVEHDAPDLDAMVDDGKEDKFTDAKDTLLEKSDGESKEKENGDKIDHQVKEETREEIIAKAKTGANFDIVPSVALPYTSQCHSLAFSYGPKWILTGGEDGFIRKYDFIASVEGKSPLTMAQKHNMVDTITKAGVISSYWENEQPLTKEQLMKEQPKIKVNDFISGSATYEPKVNPVYSLGVERNGNWCLSGVLSGGISLYTMRYNEGAIHHYFRDGNKSNGHTDAVSVIKINNLQDSFLSGSWDKTIRSWDLNTGDCTKVFRGSSGQVSSIEYRPMGLTDLSLSFEQDDAPKAEDNKSDIDSLFGDSDNDGDVNDDEKRKASERSDKAPPKLQTDSSTIKNQTFTNDNVFLSSSIDGTIRLWDSRTDAPILQLGTTPGTPPWCMSAKWSGCGEFIYAGRRNSTVEEFSIKKPHKRDTSGRKPIMIPNVSRLLLFPKISGPVSAISTMPNSDYILCGSNDNIRLYNLKLYDDFTGGSTNSKKPATPFTIIPGHHGGILSNLYVDETGRFMVSASGNRGWGRSAYTDAVLIYEIEQK